MNTDLQQRIERIHSICGAWGLYEPGNSSAIKQALKATSEIGELADAVLKNDIDEIKDAIGDIFVCWVNYTKLGLESMGFVGQKCSYSTIEETILNIFGDVPNPPYLEFVANHYNLTLLECIDSAIEVISKRAGKLVNGAFVKDVEQEEITDELTLKRIDAMVKDMGIDLDGDIHQQLADKFVKD